MDAPTDTAIIETVTAAGLPQRRLWLSPLQRRRWEVFKLNRRGFWSLWLFLFLFGISLGSEFIANDKPILVKYDGQLYWPIFKAYPETAFGGIFETEAEYRDPAVKEMIAKTRRMGALAADPLLLQHPEQESADGVSGEAHLDADRRGLQARGRARLSSLRRQPRMELARHRRPGPRRHRPRAVRLSPVGAVRPHAHAVRLDHRRRRRRVRRAISAAGPICCSSASSRSGPACRRSIS